MCAFYRPGGTRPGRGLAALRGGQLAAGMAACLAVSSPPARAVEADAQSLPIRGIVTSLNQAALSTELLTPIARIGFREGERFRAGDVLVEFDCRRQRHELEALAAAVREAKVAVETNAYLIRSGAAHRHDVAIAAARHDKAHAEWRAMEERLAGCSITAPFAGSVVDLAINPHETPQPNRPFLTITGDENLEIELIVPSRLIGDLPVGAGIAFAIDETQRTYEARILRTGGAVDPMSQTVKLYAGFVAPPEGVMPGMSGSSVFYPQGGR